MTKKRFNTAQPYQSPFVTISCKQVTEENTGTFDIKSVMKLE